MTPKLRFPEFTNEWQMKSLNELIDRIESGVSVNSEDRPKKDGEYGILKTSAVASGAFYPKENKAIPQTELSRAKLNPQKDTIIVSRMNTPQLVGESGYIAKTYDDLFIPDRLWSVTIKAEYDAKWLSYILASDHMRNVLSNIASGTSNSMKNISQPSFLAIKVLTPKQDEQQKIADFLTTVDKKIEMIDKEVELLKQYKKGVMQKIFTRQIRFISENGKNYSNWKEVKLGEIGEIVTGKTPSTQDKSHWEGNVQFVTPSDISDNIKYQEWAERSVSITQDKILPAKSIMFTCIASIGKMSMTVKPAVTNQQINSLIPKYSYHNEYIYYSLLWLKPKIISTQSNNTLPIINKTEFSKFTLPIPNMEEQQKIADFLSSIDTKINTEETKLDNAKKFKKALLQRMFI